MPPWFKFFLYPEFRFLGFEIWGWLAKKPYFKLPKKALFGPLKTMVQTFKNHVSNPTSYPIQPQKTLFQMVKEPISDP